jgi:hypothetical protein
MRLLARLDTESEFVCTALFCDMQTEHAMFDGFNNTSRALDTINMLIFVLDSFL